MLRRIVHLQILKFICMFFLYFVLEIHNREHITIDSHKGGSTTTNLFHTLKDRQPESADFLNLLHTFYQNFSVSNFKIIDGLLITRMITGHQHVIIILLSVVWWINCLHSWWVTVMSLLHLSKKYISSYKMALVAAARKEFCPIERCIVRTKFHDCFWASFIAMCSI